MILLYRILGFVTCWVGHHTWTWQIYLAWIATVVLAMELIYLTAVFLATVYRNNRPPNTVWRVKRLAHIDWLYILHHKFTVSIFTCYIAINNQQSSPTFSLHVGWAGMWSNVMLPYCLLFLAYDIFYTLLHYLLHNHYHKFPFRNNYLDTESMHPVEVILRESVNVGAVKILSWTYPWPIHISTVFLFLSSVSAVNHKIQFGIVKRD